MKVGVALRLAVGEAVAVRRTVVGLADRSVRRAIKVEMWPGGAVTGTRRGLGVGEGGLGWQAASAANRTMTMKVAALRWQTEPHSEMHFHGVIRPV